MYRKGPKRENGQKSPVTQGNRNDRNIRNKNTKITGADSAEHLTGQDNTFAQPER